MKEIDFARIEKLNELYEFSEVVNLSTVSEEDKLIMQQGFNFHSTKIPETFSFYDLQNYLVLLI